MIKTFIYTGLLSTLLSTSSAAKSHDYTAPKDAVNSYRKAVKTGSSEYKKMAFQASASIQYYNQKAEFKQFTRDEFANAVNTGNEWDASINKTSVKKGVLLPTRPSNLYGASNSRILTPASSN